MLAGGFLIILLRFITVNLKGQLSMFVRVPWLGSLALMRMKKIYVYIIMVISVGFGVKPTQVSNLGFFY